MARSFHKNKKPRDRFTVEIESLDQDGRGVAHREGKAVFVEGALPHEVVTYERIRNKTSFEIGRLVELHNEGPLRVKPRCPHFGLEPGVLRRLRDAASRSLRSGSDQAAGAA